MGSRVDSRGLLVFVYVYDPSCCFKGFNGTLEHNLVAEFISPKKCTLLVS